MATVKPIPAGRHVLTPNLVIAGCSQAMTFYRKALGAEVVSTFTSPDGQGIWHAELRIGDSIFYCADEMPGMSPPPPSTSRPSPVSFWIWVTDCDAAFKRAVEAGCTVKGKPEDMFWGDRCAGVADPFGYAWTFATRVKELTQAEMAKAGEAFAKKMGMK
jgi:PhnB protein